MPCLIYGLHGSTHLVFLQALVRRSACEAGSCGRWLGLLQGFKCKWRDWPISSDMCEELRMYVGSLD